MDGDGLWKLDPDTLKWAMIERSNFGPYGGLYGSDGELVVMRTGNTYAWLAVP